MTQLRPSENTDRISYKEFAQSILEGGSLEDKFFFCTPYWSEWEDYILPRCPGRFGRIKFSERQVKFPSPRSLSETDKKAIALHSFANHELLAIEMMAAAILIYPHETEEGKRFKRGILSSLKDEQKHLGLYIRRLNELGYEFGDFPLNDFFWRQMENLKTPSHYTAVMSLTFEAANLDFANYYAQIFHSFGDYETASILNTVLEDEIGHVAFGAHWMKRWSQHETLWDFYNKSLPWPLTPARSMGIGFSQELHFQAVGDEAFVASLINYKDDFRITKRSK